MGIRKIKGAANIVMAVAKRKFVISNFKISRFQVFLFSAKSHFLASVLQAWAPWLCEL
jgi:hypothetical protein